jgi:hypothetical protein
MTSSDNNVTLLDYSFITYSYTAEQVSSASGLSLAASWPRLRYTILISFAHLLPSQTKDGSRNRPDREGGLSPCRAWQVMAKRTRWWVWKKPARSCVTATLVLPMPTGYSQPDRVLLFFAPSAGVARVLAALFSDSNSMTRIGDGLVCGSRNSSWRT